MFLKHRIEITLEVDALELLFSVPVLQTEYTKAKTHKVC